MKNKLINIGLTPVSDPRFPDPVSTRLYSWDHEPPPKPGIDSRGEMPYSYFGLTGQSEISLGQWESRMKPARGRRPVAADGILEAAGRVFSKQGYYRSTVDDVCSAAGIGKGTVYRHFRDKEGLLTALLLRTADELDARLSEGRPAAGGLEGSLRVIARLTLEYFSDRPDFMKLFVREGTLAIPAVRVAMAGVIRRKNLRLAELLGGRSRLPEAAVFHGMVFGLLRQKIGIANEKIHPAREAAFLANLFLRGFKGNRRKS